MRVAVIPLVVYALAMGWAFFRVDGPGTFAAFFILHTILAGIWNTVIAGFAQIVLPSSHFTQLVSAAAICSTLAATLIAPLLGWFLDQTGHDYRFTFGLGAIFAGISLVAWLALSRRFRALGGVPPAP
jgi:hypothetical protein